MVKSTHVLAKQTRMQIAGLQCSQHCRSCSIEKNSKMQSLGHSYHLSPVAIETLDSPSTASRFFFLDIMQKTNFLANIRSAKDGFPDAVYFCRNLTFHRGVSSEHSIFFWQIRDNRVNQTLGWKWRKRTLYRIQCVDLINRQRIIYS